MSITDLLNFSGGNNRSESLDPRVSTSRELPAGERGQRFDSLVERARMNLGSDGRSSASIRMNPRHLGHMTLNLNVNQNRVEASLVVESSRAEKLIRDELENLRQELRLQGIHVESLSIRVKESSLTGFQNTRDDFLSQGQSGQESSRGGEFRDERRGEDHLAGESRRAERDAPGETPFEESVAPLVTAVRESAINLTI